MLDYNFERQQNRYPYQVFFDKKMNIEYIPNIIKKIEEMKILSCNEGLRIDMRLKLTFHEAHKIKRKLNIK